MDKESKLMEAMFLAGKSYEQIAKDSCYSVDEVKFMIEQAQKISAEKSKELEISDSLKGVTLGELAADYDAMSKN